MLVKASTKWTNYSFLILSLANPSDTLTPLKKVLLSLILRAVIKSFVNRANQQISEEEAEKKPLASPR